MIEIRFRPLTDWPGDRTPTTERGNSPFKSGYVNTLEKLRYELVKLQASNVNIEAGFRAADIRADGFPYAGRAPADPGIILAFNSKYGALKIHCDFFRRYEDNIRAIALHLERLRLSALYGVGTRGEQYKGYAQLEAPRAPAHMTVEEAAALLGAYISLSARELLDGAAQERGDAYRIAARRTHPDRPGGDQATFQRVNEAKHVLDAHFSPAGERADQMGGL